MGLSQSSKKLRELCNTRVLAGTTHFYGNAVSTRSRTTTPLLTPPKLPFPIDLLCRPYNSVRTAVRHCDKMHRLRIRHFFV